MVKEVSKPIKACRVCGSKKIFPLISLGNLCISNFLSEGEKDPIGRQPLQLVICDPEEGGCGLVQLKHDFFLDLLYRNYWYRSGVNKSMILALADIASRSEKIAKLRAGDLVIDIGSNDATLMSSYRTSGLNIVGFEPAKNLIPYAKKNFPKGKYINDFFSLNAWKEKFSGKRAKIITAIAMFYDLEDPNRFVSDVAGCLDKDGVFIIQMSYLPSMLQQNAFDNICHEHLEYYSLGSLSNLLERHNLEVFDVELNDVNGGSFRTYVQHKGVRSVNKRVRKLAKFEEKLGLSSKKVYKEFASRVLNLRRQLQDFVKKEIKNGKKIYVYGASTKGNTLLQFYKLNNSLIVAAAERNPDKWGKKTIGSLIPIIPEERARREKPDYFLVLPWHFLKEFKEREREYLETGGKFLIPLPEFKIIGLGG